MGADLIGFCYVGDDKIRVNPKTDWKEICNALNKLIAQVPRPAILRDLSREDFEAGLEPIYEVAKAVFPKAADPRDADVDGLLREMTPKAVKRALMPILKDFVRVWNTRGDNYRRWMTRTAKVDSKTIRIGICACESWGDTPDDPLWRLCEQISWMNGTILLRKDVLGVW